MDSQPRQEQAPGYTGLNRLLKSQSLQSLLDKRRDGTFSEFLSDWKWIFSYTARYKWVVAVYVIFGVLSATLTLGASVVSKYLIDIIVGRDIDRLWLLALAMVLSACFGLVFSSLVSRISAKISIHINNDIQADVFGQIVDADWLCLSQYESGDLLNRFSSDVSAVAGNAVNWLPNVIIHVYTFLASLAVILYYDVTMALIALVSAPFLLLASRYILRKMRAYRKQVLDMNSSLMAFETETFYNLDTIKSFGVTGRYGKKLRFWQEKYRDCNLDYNKFEIKARIYTSVLGMLVAFLAFGYCLFRLWGGAITYGTMVLFLQQRATLSGNFNSLVNIIPGMLSSSVSAHRIRELSELPPEVHIPESDELTRQISRGFSVSMEDLSFAYRSGTDVITDSRFLARPGEIVALVGPSGEGKTTMLRLMLGLVCPQTGKAVLQAADGREFVLNAETRRLFSYVPQGNTVLSGTLAENLRMVREDASDEDLISALKIACAWDFVEKMPEGLNCRIGEKGRGLSEGQAQRIAIARAVLRDAPILLLDEATSALDVTTERQVLRNIMAAKPNKTCIVTTHRPSVLGLCQRVYRVVDTHVTELDREASGRMAMDF